MIALFLSIPILCGICLLAAGQKLSCDGKTTRGLSAGFLGICLLCASYASANHWGIVRGVLG